MTSKTFLLAVAPAIDNSIRALNPGIGPKFKPTLFSNIIPIVFRYYFYCFRVHFTAPPLQQKLFCPSNAAHGHLHLPRMATSSRPHARTDTYKRTSVHTISAIVLYRVSSQVLSPNTFQTCVSSHPLSCLSPLPPLHMSLRRVSTAKVHPTASFSATPTTQNRV